MSEHLTSLLARWADLGGAVLLRDAPETVERTSVEQLVAESTAACRDSSRLMWVVLEWIIRHPDQLDARVLLEATERAGDLSALGVLCDAARERRPQPVFDAVIAHCRPVADEEIFFHRVARSKLASRLTREQPIPVFRRWNYLSNELAYL